jgi:hypothetical protein
MSSLTKQRSAQWPQSDPGNPVDSSRGTAPVHPEMDRYSSEALLVDVYLQGTPFEVARPKLSHKVPMPSYIMQDKKSKGKQTNCERCNDEMKTLFYKSQELRNDILTT